MNPAKKAHTIIRTKSYDSKVLARTLQTGLLLAFSAKSKAIRLLVSIRRLHSLPAKEGGAEPGGGKVSCVHGEISGIVACSPSADATLGLCVLSEDEAERHVQAGHREEEKGSDLRKLVDVVRQNRGSDTKMGDPHDPSSVATSMARREGGGKERERRTAPGRSQASQGQIANRARGNSDRRMTSARKSRIR